MLTACSGIRGVGGIVVGVGFIPLDARGLTEPRSGGGTGIAMAAGCSGLVDSGDPNVEEVSSVFVAADGIGTRMGRREVTSGFTEAVAVIGTGTGIGDRDLAFLTTTVVSVISGKLDGDKDDSVSAG